MPAVTTAAADTLGSRRGMAAWADWYLRMGVLDPVEPFGVGRYAGSSAGAAEMAVAAPDLVPTPPGPASAAPNLLQLPPAGRAGTGVGAASTARAVAQGCRSLTELEAALGAFEDCPLAETATRLCFADGSHDAPVMMVGEAPGAEEDRLGRPFAGPSGRLLDRMLAAVGLGRPGDIYVTNVIYWRPPGNRQPTSSEIATCLPFLERQIELLRPRVLVSVGGVAAHALLELKDGVSKLRGRRFLYRPADGGAPIPTLVMFHPAYLLRQPLHKRLAWRDMLQLRDELRATPS